MQNGNVVSYHPQTQIFEIWSLPVGHLNIFTSLNIEMYFTTISKEFLVNKNLQTNNFQKLFSDSNYPVVQDFEYILYPNSMTLAQDPILHNVLVDFRGWRSKWRLNGRKILI